MTKTIRTALTLDEAQKAFVAAAGPLLLIMLFVLAACWGWHIAVEKDVQP